MDVQAPTAQTTLLILLGASAWPLSPEFQRSEAFANAARRVKAYFLNIRPFGLPAENLLDLFDADQSPDELDVAIGQFLEQRLAAMKAMGQPARDLLLYFIGHGGFVGHDADFYLAIRRTRMENPRSSGLQMMSLSDTLTERARHLRRIIVLDCCFAAAAFSAFQGGPDQVALEKTVLAFKVNHKAVGFPTKGTTLLCSSSHTSPSLLLPDGSSTMFTKAFLDTLVQGTPIQQDHLSLRDVKDAAADYLSDMRNAPRPVVLSPDQSEGDVADIPFFPNLWMDKERLRRAKEEQARAAKEERIRLAEEERVRKAEENRRRRAEETIVSPIATPESTPAPATFVPEATPAPPISELPGATEALSSPSTSLEVPSISSSALSVVPSKRGILRSNKLLIISLLVVLVLLFGIIGGVIYAANTVNRATATAETNDRIAQTMRNNIAQIDPAVARPNPDPYLPTNGKLTLYDTMNDNTNKGFGWDEGNGCTFTGSAYQVNSANGCGAKNLELNNFAFEIQVDFTLVNGYQGASILFRFVPDSPRTFYVFSIYNDGTYAFEANATSLSGANITPIIKTATPSIAIHRGVSTNVIAIVAIGSTIDLYANNVKIDSITDSSSNYGGMVLSNDGSSVNFSNAKLWTF